MKYSFATVILTPEQKKLLVDEAKKNRRSISQQILWYLQDHINLDAKEEENEQPKKRKLRRITKEVRENVK